MRCTSLLAKWCDDDNIKPYLRTGYGLILSAKKYSIEDGLGRAGYIKRVNMMQLAKEIQNMTRWQIKTMCRKQFIN